MGTREPIICKLNAVARSKGWSLDRLAYAAGYNSNGPMYRLSRGVQMPRRDMALDLACILECRVEAIWPDCPAEWRE